MYNNLPGKNKKTGHLFLQWAALFYQQKSNMKRS